jgi:molybdenum cofactor guanylyltransferase
MHIPLELDALILAGGESRRMGQDKSLLPFGGRTLIEHIAAQLIPCVHTVRISTGGHERYGHLGLPLVPDLRPGLGPLMGIASGLLASSRDWTLVVATDIPLLPLALLPVLWEHRAEGLCIVPRTADGQVQPLFALYHRRLAERMVSFLDQGQRRVLDFVAESGAVRVSAEGVKIENLNDRRAYEAALMEASDLPPERP